jgi:hypothetical protein
VHKTHTTQDDVVIPNVYDAAAVPTATRQRKRKAVVTEEKTIEETLMELNEDDEDDKDFDLNDNKVRKARDPSPSFSLHQQKRKRTHFHLLYHSSHLVYHPLFTMEMDCWFCSTQ